MMKAHMGLALAALAASATTLADARNLAEARHVTRAVAGSLRGRQLTQAKGAVVARSPLSPHNQAIEDARRTELAARAARRAARPA